MGVNSMSSLGYQYPMATPMMNFGASGDFYTDMMQQQLMQQYQTQYGDKSTQQGDSVSFSGNQAGVSPTETKGGSTFGRAAVFGLGGAGIGAVGMGLLNHGLNSPVVTENGVTKFTDKFLASFANERAIAENAESYKQLFVDLGLAKDVNAFKKPEAYQEALSKFARIKDGLGGYINVTDPNELKTLYENSSPELQKFLKDKRIVDVSTTGRGRNLKIASVTQGSETAISKYAEILEAERTFNFKNNINIQRSAVENFDDFQKEISRLSSKKAGKKVPMAEKIAFLQENKYLANLSSSELETLYNPNATEADIKSLLSKVNSRTNASRKTTLEALLKQNERKLDTYASNFDKGKGLFGHLLSKEGAFTNIADKKVSSQLTNALKNFRMKGAGKAALIVGGIGLVFGLLTKKK